MSGKYKSIIGKLVTLILIATIMLNVIILCTSTLAQEVPRGPWVDEVIFSLEEDQAKALDMLKKNEIQAYFTDIADPELFKEIKQSPELKYVLSYGSYFELTFNPVGPEF
ncbi:MAG: ABC transporter substrate-binding protein, partial [Thermoprotei archaeon]